MSPPNSFNNSDYSSGTYSKMRCRLSYYQTSISMFCSYFFNVFFRNLASMMSLALSLVSSFLSYCIHVVVMWSPCSKMVRIAAGLSINAGMKNKESIGNVLLIGNYPRKSVSVEVCCSGKSLAYKVHSIAIWFYISFPRPAFIWSLDFYIAPKSVYEFFRQELSKHFRWDNFRTHDIQLFDCCDTLSAEPTARGHFLFII